MPNRASSALAAFGTMFFIATGVVPTVMWPRTDVASGSAKLAALLVGGILLLAGVVCWVGSVAVKRR